MIVRDFRDPLYEYVRVSGAPALLVDTPEMQRMHEIRQLGFAYLVYPSANHKRFEHMIGAYYLCKQVLAQMRERGEILPEDEEAVEVVQIAALLHDLAHYPSAHLLEEYGLKEADHEEAAESILSSGKVGEILRSTGIPDCARKVAEVVQHKGTNPLRTLVAGAVDVDRLDYLRRDAQALGLPVCFEQQRLVNALTLAPHPETGERTVMLYWKGINALDDMLWQRYSLYVKVYRHATSRAASLMGRAVLLQARQLGLVDLPELQRWTDEEMFFVLRSRLSQVEETPETVAVMEMLNRLKHRRLYKLATQAPHGSIPYLDAGRLQKVEQRLAEVLRLPAWGALLDIPHKPKMFEPDIYILRKNGDVVHRRDLTPEDQFLGNERNDAMYRGAGTIRLFTSEAVTLSTESLLGIVQDAIEE